MPREDCALICLSRVLLVFEFVELFCVYDEPHIGGRLVEAMEPLWSHLQRRRRESGDRRRIDHWPGRPHRSGHCGGRRPGHWDVTLCVTSNCPRPLEVGGAYPWRPNCWDFLEAPLWQIEALFLHPGDLHPGVLGVLAVGPVSHG